MLAAHAFAQRAERLREALDVDGHDAMIVTSTVNVGWLTGFFGSAGRLVVTPERMVLITDARYEARAASEIAAGVEVSVAAPSSVNEVIIGVLGSRSSVAAEGGRVPYTEFVDMQKRFGVVDGAGVIERLRRVKDRGELARLRRAAEIADLSWKQIASRIDEMTEREVAVELEYQMVRNGAEGAAFDTIVASGSDHGARPHHRTSDRALTDGDTLIVDFGAIVDGYHSDMTRSFVVGTPSARQTEIYAVLLEAQLAAIAAIEPGVGCAAVDQACREVLDSAGLGEWFTHGLGHGVGLEIHEEPIMGRNSKATLGVGEVVTVEPGVYSPTFGGFRVEDMVVVTADGPEILTGTPKDRLTI